MANPLDPRQLLVGSNDWNCPDPSSSGFHLSNDGGSAWNVVCMPLIRTKYYVFWPGGDPMVGYDRNGFAYIATGYADSETGFIGFVGLQKSQDGVHWSKPAVALIAPETFPADNWLVVDTNVTSLFRNSLYVSGVLVGPPGVQSENQVAVSHSNDGGKTWKRAALDPVQTYPAEDGFTNMVVGSDGSLYATWLHCASSGQTAGCLDGTAYMLFSKSLDGGST